MKILNKKNNRGVSLAEMLIVVAILLILMAVGIPSVMTIQKNLRQTELDAKAETIYVAVQNKLTSLYTGGRATVYDPSTYAADGSMKLFGTYPGDYDPDLGESLNEDSIYYILSGTGNAPESIVTSDVLDDELRNGHWVIELVPYAYRENESDQKILTAATVYAVYYSEDRANVAVEYAEGGSVNSDYIGRLRDKSVRLQDGARVGYYGGAGVASSATTSSLSVDTVKIHSEEEILTASVKCKKPASISDPLEFRFDLSDTKGNKFTVYYFEKEGLFKTEEGFLYNQGNITVRHVGQSYSFVITLDDLSKSATRFNQLYGAASGHNNGGSYTDRELVCGTELKLEVTVSCPDDHTVDSASKYDIGNSLFSDTSTEDTAFFTCGRHLQNLDQSSNVTDEITKVQQASNISFGEDSEWHEKYGSAYFNGITRITRLTATGTTKANAANFKPITNKNLTVFNGKNEDSKYSIAELTVNDNNSTGLFAVLGNTEISLNDITMTGTRVKSSGDAGALVGTVSGTEKVTISGCQIYLSKDNGDIPTNISGDAHAEATRWISGTNAGGLVGKNDGKLIITTSSASTVIGETNSGGLIGNNTGTVTMTKSYADCYLYGTNAGGLIGNSSDAQKKNVTFDRCYAAGFIGLKDVNSTGAGFVNGQVENAKSSYTIVACYGQTVTGEIDKDSGKIDKNRGEYYSTVQNGSKLEKVFYFNAGTKNGNDINTTHPINGMTTNELQNALGADEDFEINTIGTQPYKMMGQSLTTYTYPRLKELAHYGDWETVFQSGALVYYEKYQPEKGVAYYGFDGAGVDISLSGKDEIVGDGYGVVFRENDSLPTTVTVTIAGTEVKTFEPEKEAYFTVVRREGTDSISYRIYPLSKETVNPKEAVTGYYSRVKISQTANGNTTSTYYDYNPHFARSVQEVVAEDSAVSNIDTIISIRSPRHLYNLSKYYDIEKKNGDPVEGYRNLSGNRTYGQERNIVFSSYEWSSYTLEDSTFKEQEPIGKTESSSFKDSYNGNCYYISDISFVSQDANYIGMFGYVEKGANLRNIVLGTDYKRDDESSNYRVQRTKPAGANEKIYYGVLSGYNRGTINNCAVAGYYLSGSDGTIHGYANSRVYIGGLVGWNEGTIRNSEADCPRMRLSMYRTTCYAGGFVGWNESIIQNCYDLNHIDAIADGGNTVIAGFVAQNSGSIRQSYCATALTASGEGVHSYGFVPSDGGGVVSECYYLQAGSYQFVDGLYAYEAISERGTKRTYQQLVSLNNNKAKNSYFHDNTTRLNSSETNYPYRAVVTDGNGNAVHYGEWQTKPELGTIGIFYWEYETDGENNGYKLTYIGTSEGSSQYQTTLCTAHDDGGVISSYGYGYYVLNGEEGRVTYQLEDIAKPDISADGMGSASVDKQKGNYNQDAAAALANQMPGYTFYPYTTKTEGDTDFIYLSGTKANGTWTLHYDNGSELHSYQYKLTPFFANAMQYSSGGAGSSFVITDSANHQTHYAETPGSDKNQYEIRSAQQLQYINWNYQNKNTSTLVGKTGDDQELYKKYNYLMFTQIDGSGKQTQENAGNKVVNNWRQTHDVNASRLDNFTPIAGQVKSSSPDSYGAVLYAWFGGNYNGENYKISELQIVSNSATVGMFGVTAGGTIKNIVLYSENNAEIKRITNAPSDINDENNSATSYAIGGMVGVAYRYEGQTGDKITNCSIAGYHIVDESKNKQGLGEANVGGLIGVANVSLENCSAVIDIEINCTHPSKQFPSAISTALHGNYIRVGGIAGATQFSLTDCYSGGNITVADQTLDENYGGNRIYVSQDSGNALVDKKLSTNIYIAGIAGSGFAMNYINFTQSDGLKEGSPVFNNCYTYVNFPDYRGTIRSIALIGSVADRHSANGPTVTINNCYYLSTSAEIDISNAPKFKLNQGTDSVYNLINNGTSTSGTKYFEDMLSGNSCYVAKIIDNEEHNKLQGDKPVPKTYSQLSDDAMVSALNNGRSVWGKVSTVDASGGSINGKYSFPGNAGYLDGKDYPYPTVVKQTDPTFGNTVNVHYGEWPLPGARWTKGTDSINIFDYINEEGWATKEYVFDPNGETGLSITADSFIVDHTDIAAVASVTDEVDGTYKVKIKALKEGTVTITERTSGASFVLDITAGLKVTATLEKMILEKDEQSKLMLTAVSKSGLNSFDYSTSNAISWSVTPSCSKDESGDVGVARQDALSNHKNLYTITGYGYNATLKITADYNYQGVHFPGTAIAIVQRTGVVGLSNGSSYVEAPVRNTDGEEITGTEKEYSQESSNRPKDVTNAAFFLYDTESAGLLNAVVDEQGVTISCVASSTNHHDTEITATLSGGLSSGEDTDFRILTGKLTYEPPVNEAGNAGMIDDVTLTVKVIKGDNTSYVLTMTGLKATPLKPITATLHKNAVDGTDQQEVQNDWRSGKEQITPTCPFEAELGYKFVGWNTEKDGSGTSFLPGTKITLDKNTDLYAQWELVKKLTLIDGNRTVAQTNSGVLLDESYVQPVREGWELSGWYTEKNIDTGKKVLNADGTVYQTVEGYTSNGEISLSEDKEVYACWRKGRSIWVPAITLESGKRYLISNAKDGENVAIVCQDQKATNTSSSIYKLSAKEGLTFTQNGTYYHADGTACTIPVALCESVESNYVWTAVSENGNIVFKNTKWADDFLAENYLSDQNGKWPIGAVSSDDDLRGSIPGRKYFTYAEGYLKNNQAGIVYFDTTWAGGFTLYGNGGDKYAYLLEEQSIFEFSFADNYTLTLHADSDSESVYKIYGDDSSLPPSYSNPVKTGERFTGWYTAATDGEQVIDSSGNFVISISSDMDLYAHWEEIHEITLSYGIASEQLASIPITADLTDLSAVDGYVTPTKTNWTFEGWYTKNTGTGGAKVIDETGHLVDGQTLIAGQVYYAGWSRIAWAPVSSLEDAVEKQVFVGRMFPSNPPDKLFRALYYPKRNTENDMDSGWFKSDAVFIENAYNASGKSIPGYMKTTDMNDGYRWIVRENENQRYVLESVAKPGNYLKQEENSIKCVSVKAEASNLTLTYTDTKHNLQGGIYYLNVGSGGAFSSGSAYSGDAENVFLLMNQTISSFAYDDSASLSFLSLFSEESIEIQDNSEREESISSEATGEEIDISEPEEPKKEEQIIDALLPSEPEKMTDEKEEQTDGTSDE